jgi:uncharacterized membrane protein
MIAGNTVAWVGFSVIVVGTAYDLMKHQSIRVQGGTSRTIFFTGAGIVLAGVALMALQGSRNSRKFATFADTYLENIPEDAVIDDMAGLALDS